MQGAAEASSMRADIRDVVRGLAVCDESPGRTSWHFIGEGTLWLPPSSLAVGTLEVCGVCEDSEGGDEDSEDGQEMDAAREASAREAFEGLRRMKEAALEANAYRAHQRWRRLFKAVWAHVWRMGMASIVCVGRSR